MRTSNKNTAKTAAVMNLISRRPDGVNPALGGGVPITREQIEYLDIDLLDDDPRNFYELSGLDELAANIELLGLQQPLRVRPSEDPGRYVIVSGHRRRAAVRQLVEGGHGNLRDIPCIVERGQASAALQELRLIYANSDIRKMTSADIGRQAERVEELLYQLKEEGYEFPGRMRDHVAEACKVSKSKLSRLKVIRENLEESWSVGYEKGKLAESAAYALAQMPQSRQRVIYDGLAKQGQYPNVVSESCGESVPMDSERSPSPGKCGILDALCPRGVLHSFCGSGWNGQSETGGFLLHPADDGPRLPNHRGTGGLEAGRGGPGM